MGRKIQVWISCKQVSFHMDTLPFSFPVRLHCHAVRTTVCTVPVVEFMSSYQLAGPEISLAPLRRCFPHFSLVSPDLPAIFTYPNRTSLPVGYVRPSITPVMDIYCRLSSSISPCRYMKPPHSARHGSPAHTRSWISLEDFCWLKAFLPYNSG